MTFLDMGPRKPKPCSRPRPHGRACGSSGGGDDTNVPRDGTVLDQNAGRRRRQRAGEHPAPRRRDTAAPAAEIKQTIADWEALWETERAAVVKNIKDNGWG
ncbi:MAG: hypothetical protein R2761_13725 [Acidimicrobiales bacterium]